MHAATEISLPQAQRNRAIAAMNRGCEALQLGELAAALAAYDEAIALLRPLPLAENPSWANSLGAALMNRGHLLHRLHGLARADEALAALEEAAALLRTLAAPADLSPSALQSFSPSPPPWAARNLAGTLLNRANLLLDLQRDGTALLAAREALALVRANERRDRTDAELALKARRAACDALGRLLPTAGTHTDMLATEASDLVDDALALLRHWRERGVASRELTFRFFRFGTQLYRHYQPHFLAEFVRENLPRDDDEFRTVAHDAVRLTLEDRPRAPAYLVHGDAATERHLRTLRELEMLRDEIAAPAAPSCLHA
jgi:tetratricopeptide (TPR) repeat protein